MDRTFRQSPDLIKDKNVRMLGMTSVSFHVHCWLLSSGSKTLVLRFGVVSRDISFINFLFLFFFK